MAAAPVWGQADKPRRIAILSPVTMSLEQFRRSSLAPLHKAGFEERRNLAVDFRAGPAGDLPQLAAELVQIAPDAILAVSLPSVDAARRATGKIPIVFIASADPIVAGW